jgi:hypothetical protein
MWALVYSVVCVVSVSMAHSLRRRAHRAHRVHTRCVRVACAYTCASRAYANIPDTCASRAYAYTCASRAHVVSMNAPIRAHRVHTPWSNIAPRRGREHVPCTRCPVHSGCTSAHSGCTSRAQRVQASYLCQAAPRCLGPGRRSCRIGRVEAAPDVLRLRRNRPAHL